jgi:hypothetical protein
LFVSLSLFGLSSFGFTKKPELGSSLVLLCFVPSFPQLYLHLEPDGQRTERDKSQQGPQDHSYSD